MNLIANIIKKFKTFKEEGEAYDEKVKKYSQLVRDNFECPICKSTTYSESDICTSSSYHFLCLCDGCSVLFVNPARFSTKKVKLD